MGLSERERKIMEEIERAWEAETPAGARNTYPGSKKLVLGVLLVLAGLITLIAGVALALPALGIVAFIIMLTGSLRAFRGFQEMVLAGYTPRRRFGR